MTNATTSLGWGDAKGGAQKNNVPNFKLEKGTNQFRIISGVVPRYVYWVNNSEGKPRPFECLQFDRASESFNNAVPCPIREAGITEFDKQKQQNIPLRAKRAYVCLVINRKTNAIEALDLKSSIFNGIKETALQLEKSPLDFDVFVNKTGSTWVDTEYTVMQINCMKDANADNSARDAADAALIAEFGKTIDELYPRPTYAQVKAGLEAWLQGASGNTDTGGETQPAVNSEASAEAVAELDD